MGRKRTKTKLLMCLMAASTIVTGILGSVPLYVRAADHEARIGDVYYEDIESAFRNVQAGETITVLKDCSVSGTLRVTRDDITLKSEDADAPVTVSRDEDFIGKTYGVKGGSVLLEVTGGSLTTRDIIFDGGAVLNDEFNNSGRTWQSALVYVDGSYTMASGTVLQNNYVADGESLGLYTAGGLYVAAEGTLAMDGGLIQNCCTNGNGGGVYAGQNTSVTAASGTIRNCYAISGGGMNLDGTAELSNMTFTGNTAGSSGGGIFSAAPLTVDDSLFEGNRSDYDGGGVCTATGHLAHITGCTFTGNTAARGSAIQTAKGEGTLPLVIRDCTFTGNPTAGFSHAGGAICYGNETGIILAGKIVMEDNLTAGLEPCDIHYFYNTGASILLDEDFESDSTFVLGGYDSIKPGRVLIDGKLYHKNATTEQFVWHSQHYCTEKKGENIYLAEVPKPVTVTITYIYNNAIEEGTDSAQVIPGANIIFPDAVRKGYSFKGWYEDETLTVFAGNAGEEHPAPEKDTTYYAAWEKADATVTFDADGGKVEGGDVTAKVDDTITLPSCTKDGYEFVGWYDNDTCAGQAGEDYTVTSDVTLKAHYVKKEAPTCIVSFDTDGGKEIVPVKVEKGKTVSLPEAEKENHIFLGWYTEKEGGEKIGLEITVTEDVTIYAHWEKKSEIPEERPEATITFDADGGKMEGGDITAKVGDTITLPVCTKDGYEFIGWYDNETCAGQAGEDYTVTGDVTLKARYEKKETPEERPEAVITFDADGGKMEGGDVTAKVGDTITFPACTKDGYEFIGWYDNDTCAGQAGEDYTVTGDVVLKARYEKKAETTYLITFDPNGGRKAEHIRAAEGEKITLPGTEKTGYIFLGWYTEKDGGILLGIAGDEMEVTKDMTVYALWEKERSEETGDKEPETCKAVFHTEGGKLKNETLTIVKGAGLYLPLPEIEGYDFAGWYLDKSLTQFAGTYRDSYRITNDTDFYAKWEKAKEDNSNDDDADQGSNTGTKDTYTVKYDANGGAVKEASVKVEKGAGVKLPTAEREGFTFKGWYTDKQAFIGKAGSTYKPDQDITLYAKWERTASGDNSGNIEDGTDSDTKKEASAAGTDTDKKSESSMSDSEQDKKADTSVEKASGTQTGTAEAETKKEPVIQTGHTTPIYLFAAFGMFGVLLAALSIREGKHGSEK